MFINKKKNQFTTYYSIASTVLSLDRIQCKISPIYLKTIISHSLFYYWTEIVLHCKKIQDWNIIHKHYNSYAFLSDKITNSNHTFTKIGNQYTHIFYEIIETVSNVTIPYDSGQNKYFYHFGPHCEHVKQAFLYINKGHIQNHMCYPNVCFQNSFNQVTINSYYSEFITLSSLETNEYLYALDILKQLCIAVCIQQNKGIMMFKVNTIFQSLTIDILYLVCSLYEKVYITKPVCDNPCDFSKYILCTGFINQPSREMFISTFQSLHFYLCNLVAYQYVERILSIQIPLQFMNKMEELNSMFGQPCLEHIQYILNNKCDMKVDKLKFDIQKCHEWCVKYKVQSYE